MDKNSRILTTVFALIVVVSVFISFYRYIIIEDFVIYTDEELFMEELPYYELDTYGEEFIVDKYGEDFLQELLEE